MHHGWGLWLLGVREACGPEESWEGMKRPGAAMRSRDCESWRPGMVLEISNESISVEPARGFSGQTHRGASWRPTEPAPNASIQGTLNALVHPLMNNFSSSNPIRDTRGHGSVLCLSDVVAI